MSVDRNKIVKCPGNFGRQVRYMYIYAGEIIRTCIK